MAQGGAITWLYLFAEQFQSKLRIPFRHFKKIKVNYFVFFIFFGHSLKIEINNRQKTGNKTERREVNLNSKSNLKG